MFVDHRVRYKRGDEEKQWMKLVLKIGARSNKVTPVWLTDDELKAFDSHDAGPSTTVSMCFREILYVANSEDVENCLLSQLSLEVPVTNGDVYMVLTNTCGEYVGYESVEMARSDLG